MPLQITAAMLFLVLPFASSAQSNGGPGSASAVLTASVATASSAYRPVRDFDPSRDAAADIRSAQAEARRTHKNILLDVGGDWCMYCVEMDQFLRRNPALLRLRDSSFITVKVYYGTDQANRRALSAYTPLLGVPHLFVLRSDGSLLHSEHVLDLRANGEYSPVKFAEFLQHWAAQPASP